jgi:hypothetical protein
MNLRKWSWCATLSVLLGVACGAKSVPNDTPISLETFMNDYTLALCESAMFCCPTNVGAQGICGGDLMELALQLNAARADLYEYRSDAAKRCLEQIRSAKICDEGPLPVVCFSVFAGRVEPGGACQTDLECRPPAPFAEPRCLPDADGVGTCTVAAGPGDPCKYTCDVDGICYLAGHGDRACYLSQGLSCASSTCLPLVSLGGSCAGDLECASRVCHGSVCVSAGPAGSPCSFAGAGCDPGLFCSNGACTPMLQTGEACSVDSNPPCRGSCSAGACAPKTLLCAE